MISAVLDANILASGSLASRGTIAQLIEAFLANQYQVALSQPILHELQRALAKPYFAQRLPVERRERYLALVRSVAIAVPVTSDVHGVATHPEDDLVLATALSARAQYVVTGDLPFRRVGA